MFQEKEILTNLIEDVVLFIFNNLKVSVCGIVSRVIDDNNWEMDFKDNVNKLNETLTQQKLQLPILKLKNVEHHYEQGDKVLVIILDYDQNLFIKQNKNKMISYGNTNEIHSLSNGYVFMPLKDDKEDNKGKFSEEGIEIASKVHDKQLFSA